MEESIQAQFEKLIPLEDKDRHSLPFHMLNSRISTSIVLSFVGRRKAVIKLSIVLSKASRSFIVSQLGLPGFLLSSHDNFASFLFELQSQRTLLNEENMSYIDENKYTTLALEIAEHAWKIDETERDAILERLEFQLDDNPSPDAKLQVFFDFLYSPP